MSNFKPMLACEADLKSLVFPLYGSVKLDGIRASVVDGKLLTRTLKEVPNRFIFDMLSTRECKGMDGELIIGAPNSESVYRDSVSGVMTREGRPNFTYWLFDFIDMPVTKFYERLEFMRSIAIPLRVELLPQVELQNLDDLLSYEKQSLDLGYEGLILRDPTALYKHGRSTKREGALMKLKRFVDSEALVLSVEEEMHNANEAKTNALGRTERSSHKANKIGKSRMGRLFVRDVKSGVEFHVGTGFTDEDKAWFWENAARIVGKMIVKYKFFPVGVKDLPRHPVYLGPRSPLDR